jgi:L-iditol 2-dehydrogenase
VVDTDGTRFRPGDRVLCLPMDQQGFCERFVAAESLAMPLDPATPDEHAVLAQPLGTVIHALQRLPNLLELDAAVVGQGPIGQLFCAALALLGARRIIAVDRLAARLAVSPRMGATHVVDASATDPIAAVRDLTGGAMPELVIEAVGHHEQALDLCVELCRPRGIVLMFGIPPAEPRGNPLFRVLRANLTLYSSSTGDLSRNFPLAMQWIDRRRIDVSPLLTHRFPLHQVQEAFDTFAERRDGALKVLIDFGAPRPRS